jgi:hypothetical protein
MRRSFVDPALEAKRTELHVGNLWSLATIIGPILLVVVIVWAISRNRKQSPREVARSERGVHDLYERTDREERRGNEVDR